MTRRTTSTNPPASADDVAELTRALYRQAAAIAAEIAAASGMHPTDVNAMRLLDLAGSQRPTMGELGAALHLSSAAVTGLVDRLEAHGLARRVADPADRRRVRVEATETAHRVGEEMLRPLAERIAAAVEAATPADRAAVAAFLRTVVGA